MHSAPLNRDAPDFLARSHRLIGRRLLRVARDPSGEAAQARLRAALDMLAWAAPYDGGELINAVLSRFQSIPTPPVKEALLRWQAARDAHLGPTAPTHNHDLHPPVAQFLKDQCIKDSSLLFTPALPLLSVHDGVDVLRTHTDPHLWIAMRAHFFHRPNRLREDRQLAHALSGMLFGEDNARQIHTGTVAALGQTPIVAHKNDMWGANFEQFERNPGPYFWMRYTGAILRAHNPHNIHAVPAASPARGAPQSPIGAFWNAWPMLSGHRALQVHAWLAPRAHLLLTPAGLMICHHLGDWYVHNQPLPHHDGYL